MEEYFFSGKSTHYELSNAWVHPSLALWIGGVPHLSSRAKSDLNVHDYTSVQELCHVLPEALHVISIQLSQTERPPR